MVNTSNFINDRLIIIEKELGNVDAEIEVFKRENQLTDIHSEAGMYLQEGSQYSQEGLGLENQDHHLILVAYRILVVNSNQCIQHILRTGCRNVLQ